MGETRRSVMRAFGEYVDFLVWLRDAKAGVNVEPDDPSTSELAQAVHVAENRYREKLHDFLGYEATP